jgi:uncharacterized membrane protein YdjX (TVP38/TMEM64 family)
MNISAFLTASLTQIASLGVLAPLAFIGIYVVATIAFLPGSILTLGAGVVFGVVWGSLYVFIGATIGAVLAFLVGRYLARDWVSQRLKNLVKFQQIDRAVAQGGFKIVLLTRLSPIFPFNLLNYAFGVTGVSLKDYTLASIGMLPGTVMYVYIGSLGGDLAQLGTRVEPNPVLQWTIRTIGFLATLAVTIYVTKLARAALTEVVDEAKEVK